MARPARSRLLTLAAADSVEARAAGRGAPCRPTTHGIAATWLEPTRSPQSKESLGVNSWSLLLVINGVEYTHTTTLRVRRSGEGTIGSGLREVPHFSRSTGTTQGSRSNKTRIRRNPRPPQDNPCNLCTRVPHDKNLQHDLPVGNSTHVLPRRALRRALSCRPRGVTSDLRNGAARLGFGRASVLLGPKPWLWANNGPAGVARRGGHAMPLLGLFGPEML